MMKLPHGIEYKNNTIVYPRSACAVCYNNGKLLLVKQPRLKRTMFELPGGVCEAHEGVVEAALRELTEESGYCAMSGKLMMTLDLDTSASVHQTSLVMMQGIRKGEIEGEYPSEWLEIGDLIKMIDGALITHAPTVVAILKLWAMITGDRI